MSKIFGIGLSHTGTTSLCEALNILGIRSIHWPLDRKTYSEISSGSPKLTILEEYQAVADITTVPIYRQMDRSYPGSKFILTVRDKEGWMASMQKVNKDWLKYVNKNLWQKFWIRLVNDYPHLKIRAFKKAMFRVLYDRMIEFTRVATYKALAFQDEQRLSDIYDDHHKNVLEYFDNRHQDLLVLNLFQGDGWEKLCNFLNKDIPDKPFPKIVSNPLLSKYR